MLLHFSRSEESRFSFYFVFSQFSHLAFKSLFWSFEVWLHNDHATLKVLHLVSKWYCESNSITLAFLWYTWLTDIWLHIKRHILYIGHVKQMSYKHTGIKTGKEKNKYNKSLSNTPEGTHKRAHIHTHTEFRLLTSFPISCCVIRYIIFNMKTAH